jgi:hypothetical protein
MRMSTMIRSRGGIRLLVAAACLGLGIGAFLLFGPSHGGGRLAGGPAEAHGGAFHPSPIPPVSLPAQANVAALKTAPSLTPSQLKQLLAEAPDLTPPASQPADWTPGKALMHQARVLMTNVGTAKRTIYAYPTSRGRVCAVLTDYSSGCLDGFRDRFADVDFTYGRGIVWGLVPNSVAAVDVDAAGIRRPARLENNVYFFEGDAPQQLVVRFRDGSTKSVALPTVTIPSGTG